MWRSVLFAALMSAQLSAAEYEVGITVPSYESFFWSGGADYWDSNNARYTPIPYQVVVFDSSMNFVDYVSGTHHHGNGTHFTVTVSSPTPSFRVDVLFPEHHVPGVGGGRTFDDKQVMSSAFWGYNFTGGGSVDASALSWWDIWSTY